MKSTLTRLLLSVLIACTFQIHGQESNLTQRDIDLIDRFAERFDINDRAVESFKKRITRNYSVFPGEETIYDRIRVMMRVNDPDFYIAPFPISNNLKTYTGENKLLPEEGNNGYVLEMRLAQRFPIIQPRYSRSDAWIRWKLLTVNYDFVYRVAAHSDDSDDSPGLPMNTKFGLTLFETAIPLTWRGSAYFKKKKSEPVNKNFTTELLGNNIVDCRNLIILVPRLDFTHYSNGQHANPYFVPASGPIVRNNYANGNFSTNYLLGQLDLTTLNKNTQLFNLYVGYRYDFGFSSLLSFDSTQNGRYGKQRAVAGITFRSGPMLYFDKISDPQFMQRLFEYSEQLAQYIRDGHSQAEIDKFKENRPSRDLKGMMEVYGRITGEYITSGTERFNQYKTGITAQLGATFINLRTFGLMIQAHYGRDYLNIRYDLPVFNWLLAATFNVNSYTVSDASKLYAQFKRGRVK